MELWNIGILSQHYTASQPRRSRLDQCLLVHSIWSPSYHFRRWSKYEVDSASLSSTWVQPEDMVFAPLCESLNIQPHSWPMSHPSSTVATFPQPTVSMNTEGHSATLKRSFLSFLPPIYSLSCHSLSPFMLFLLLFPISFPTTLPHDIIFLSFLSFLFPILFSSSFFLSFFPSFLLYYFSLFFRSSLLSSCLPGITSSEVKTAGA